MVVNGNKWSFIFRFSESGCRVFHGWIKDADIPNLAKNTIFVAEDPFHN